MGQDLGTLDDHLVRVVIAVVAGLGENGNGLFRYGAAILIRHDFAHQTAGGFGHSVQDRLGHAIANGSVQTLAIDLNSLHHLAQAAEVVGFLAHQLGLDVLVNDGNEVLGQEQGIPSASTGILNRGAVAVSDLTVFQDQHDRDGLASLTHGGEAFGDRLAYIKYAVMTGTLFDGPLVIEIETGTACRTNNVNNFHDL